MDKPFAQLQVQQGRGIMIYTQETTQTVITTRGAVKATGQNPYLLRAEVRKARSAPKGTRLKVSLTATIGGKSLPMPVGQATAPMPVPAFTTEIRLEMN